MTKDELNSFIYNMMSDTCNRFVSRLHGLGVMNHDESERKSKQIIDAKYDLLDEWVPFITQTVFEAHEGKLSLKPVRLDF